MSKSHKRHSNRYPHNPTPAETIEHVRAMMQRNFRADLDNLTIGDEPGYWLTPAGIPLTYFNPSKDQAGELIPITQAWQDCRNLQQ